MKKNDLILIGILLALGIIMLVIINAAKSEGSRVLITVDGREEAILELDKDIVYVIEGDNGERNVLEIKDGHADMTEANCPDKLCVKHRDIHYDNETIICLPNKVVIRIIDGEDSGLDAVVY
jgi:hypothetical protein